MTDVKANDSRVEEEDGGFKEEEEEEEEKGKEGEGGGEEVELDSKITYHGHRNIERNWNKRGMKQKEISELDEPVSCWVGMPLEVPHAINVPDCIPDGLASCAGKAY